MMKQILIVVAIVALTDLAFGAKLQPRVIPLYGRVGRGLDISHSDNAVLAAQMTFCAAGSVTVCENGCCPNQNWVCCSGEWLCASSKTDCETLQMLKDHPWNKNSTEEVEPEVEKDCVEKNGVCDDGTDSANKWLEYYQVADEQACQNGCKSNNECMYFYYYGSNKYCYTFAFRPPMCGREEQGSFVGGKDDIFC